MEEDEADKQVRGITVQIGVLIWVRTHSSLYFLISPGIAVLPQ